MARSTAGAAVALIGGLAISATAGAAATARGEPTLLTVCLDIPASDQLGTQRERDSLYREVLRDFEARHRGLRVSPVPYVGTTSNVTAIIAGQAPDVFADTAPSYPMYVEQGLLLRLDPYLREDDVDPAVWSATVVDALITPTGTYALSRGLDSYLFAVNLTIVEDAGLKNPSPDWSYVEFAGLSQALMRTEASSAGTVHRYGVGLQGGPGGFLGALQNPVVGFRGAVTNAARTVQLLGKAPAVQGVEWLLEELLWPGAGTINTGSANLVQGTAAIEEIQQVDLLFKVQQWRDQFRWALYPPPVYPQGRVGGAAANFWAIAASTQHTDAAWEFLHWLTLEKPFQIFLMKTFFFPPALNALMGHWQRMVEAVAPDLRGRGLGWFTAAAEQGWGRAEPYFARANAEAISIDALWWTRIRQRAVAPRVGLAQADTQVNALEQAFANEVMPSLAAQRAAYDKMQRRLEQMFIRGAGGSVRSP